MHQPWLYALPLTKDTHTHTLSTSPSLLLVCSSVCRWLCLLRHISNIQLVHDAHDAAAVSKHNPRRCCATSSKLLNLQHASAAVAALQLLSLLQTFSGRQIPQAMHMHGIYKHAGDSTSTLFSFSRIVCCADMPAYRAYSSATP